MPNFISRLFKKQEERAYLEDYIDPIHGTLQYNTFSNYTQSKALKVSTVYRCVNLISESIASLPLNPYIYNGNWKVIDYNNSLFNILNIQPNSFMGSNTFKKLMVQHTLMYGNCFIYIDRDVRGNVLSLSILNPSNIEIQFNENNISYYDKSIKATYDKTQIIHILNYTYNGYSGISTLEHAARSLGIAYDSDEHTSTFLKGGGKLSGILRPTQGTISNKEKATQAKTDFINATNPDLGGNGIVVLSNGFEYQPITISPKDSQLLESRQFNVVDVCRYFNVPPTLAFSETGKFSTAEQQQVDFLNNTLTPWIEKIENEFYRKLYLTGEYATTELKFDVENLLRTDYNSKADYYTKMYQIGGYTTNEIREKLNAQFPVSGGDRAFIQVNLQPLDNIISDQKSNLNE